ncbi:MAG: hypothetical protein WA364_11500 [Candidatus Nitrosopolaris sp.]
MINLLFPPNHGKHLLAGQINLFKKRRNRSGKIVYSQACWLLALTDFAAQEYECKMCGKKFGDSLGDMEQHILMEHMQTAVAEDFSSLK